jgi:streptogrisin D
MARFRTKIGEEARQAGQRPMSRRVTGSGSPETGSGWARGSSSPAPSMTKGTGVRYINGIARHSRLRSPQSAVARVIGTTPQSESSSQKRNNDKMPTKNRLESYVSYLGRSVQLVFCGLLVIASAVVVATPSAASANGNTVPSAEVSLLAKQQDISLALAERDLQLQQQAGDIATELQRELGAGYAGVWFDLSAAQFHIGIAPQTNKTSAEAITNRAGITTSTSFDTVTHSWADIEAAQEALNSQLASMIGKQQAAVVTSPQTNSVTVELASNLSSAVVQEVQTKVAHAAVTTQIIPVSAQSLQVHSDSCIFPNCNRPLRGGIRIFSGSNTEGFYHFCTAGFFVRDSSHNPYLLTAGHCFYPESGPWFNGTWGTATPGGGSIECIIGQRIVSRVDTGADAGVINTPLCETPIRGIVFWGVSEDEVVSESPRTAYVGLFECHVGATSETRCGNVEYANITTTINYTNDGKGIIALTHTDWFCALDLPGDSGGPVFTFSGSVATGTGINVASSGEAECGQGGHGIAYELSYALTAMGVHLAAS